MKKCRTVVPCRSVGLSIRPEATGHTVIGNQIADDMRPTTIELPSDCWAANASLVVETPIWSDAWRP
jgi:hypothetical protein